MTRTPARFTQADVARTIRAAKQAGAGGVEVRPGRNHFSPPDRYSGRGKTGRSRIENDLEPDEGAVL